MYHNLLKKIPLFNGISAEETERMLDITHSSVRKYIKDSFVFRAGDRVDCIGIVLSGRIIIERDELWGARSIVSGVGMGQIFAEVYAFSNEPLMVNAVAEVDSEILFIRSDLIYDNKIDVRFQKNLMKIMATKNLILTRKINDISPKTIRERLISYLSYQNSIKGSNQFEIYFDRQQLADYLCVDRSAMSNELSRMHRDGLVDYHKNSFTLHFNG